MRKQGQLFFFGIFALLALATLLLVKPFLGVVAVALISVVMLQPVYEFFLNHKWVHGRTRLASGATIILFLIGIILPFVLIGIVTVRQVQSIIEWFSTSATQEGLTEVLDSLETALEGVPILSNLQLNEEEIIDLLQVAASGILTWLTNTVINFASSLPAIFAGAIIFVALLISLIPSYKGIIGQLQQLSPLEIDISDIYLRKSTAMVSSMVKGIFLLAILQGFIMGVFYWLAGIPFAFVLTLASMVFAVLPAVGISFIVLPLAIIFLLTGNTGSALIILFGFYVVVNPLDVILRPRLVSKEAYLSFALILLAIFGGLQAAGVLGLIFGPVIMLLFMTTIDIYATHYAARKQEPTAEIVSTGE